MGKVEGSPETRPSPSCFQKQTTSFPTDAIYSFWCFRTNNLTCTHEGVRHLRSGGTSPPTDYFLRPLQGAEVEGTLNP